MHWRTAAILAIASAPLEAQYDCFQDYPLETSRTYGSSRSSGGVRREVDGAVFVGLPPLGELPDDAVWERVEVAWDAVERIAAACFVVRGTLSVVGDDGAGSPVDWYAGVSVLVASGATPPGTFAVGADPDEVDRQGGLVSPDGSFEVLVRGPRTDEAFTRGSVVRVALAPARRIGDEIQWASDDPVLPQSVASVPLVDPVFDLARHRRAADARVDEGPVRQLGWHLGPATLATIPEAWGVPVPAPTADDVRETVGLLTRLAEAEPGNVYSLDDYDLLPVSPASPRIVAQQRWWPRRDLAETEGIGVLRDIVGLGPRAVPTLLEHLDDPTPVGPELEIGEMTVLAYERQLWGNPLNERELGALGFEAVSTPWGRVDLRRERHQLTVGDYAFTALGQILNRPHYCASGYQGKLLVSSSPVRDAELARLVRAAWESDDACRALFDSLLLDFSSRGSASGMQLGAATRLLLWFPDAAASLVAQRIRDLDVISPEDPTYRISGVGRAELIEAVAWSPRWEIQTALLDVVERSPNADVVDACFHGIFERPAHAPRAKLLEMVRQLPAEGLGVEGRGYELLWRAWRLDPDGLGKVCAAFLAPGTLERRHSLCLFLERVPAPQPFAPELLAPLLEDRTETGWWAREGPSEAFENSVLAATHPLLVCDAAYLALRDQEGAADLPVAGTRADLDARIAALQQGLVR